MDVIFCFLICSVAILIKYLIFIYKSRRIFAFAKQFNGPGFTPFIGSGKFMYGKNFLPILKELKETYSLPCSLWIKNNYNYITDIPEEVKLILTHPNAIEKSKVYNDGFSRLFFDGSLVTAPYKKWRQDRKKQSRCFSPSLFKNYISVFYKHSCVLVDFMKKENVEKIKLKSVFTQLLHNIFTENMFGYVEDPNEETNSFVESFKNAEQILLMKPTNERYIPQWYWKWFKPSGIEFFRLYNIMRDATKEILFKKFEEGKKHYHFDEGSDGKKNILNLMDVFLNGINSKLPTDEIVPQMLFYTLGGTDTTGISILLAIVFLGMHPELQETVYKEIIRVVGQHNEVGKEHLANLKFTECVILETMRLFPVIPVIGRHIAEDINLGSIIIPKGSDVLISPYLIHRNEKYWPEPEKFIPDRFLPENSSKIQSGSYLPFSLGPRDCIGKTYAITSMKVILANIVRNFKIVSDHHSTEELKMDAYVFLKPYGNIKCKFISREL